MTIYLPLPRLRSINPPRIPLILQLMHLLPLSFIGISRALYAPLLMIAIIASILIVVFSAYYLVLLAFRLLQGNLSKIFSLLLALLILLMPSLIIKSGFCINRFAFSSDANTVRLAVISGIENGRLVKKSMTDDGPFAQRTVQKFNSADEYFNLYGDYKKNSNQSCCEIVAASQSGDASYFEKVFSNYFLDTYDTIMLKYDNNLGYVIVDSGRCLGH